MEKLVETIRQDYNGSISTSRSKSETTGFFDGNVNVQGDIRLLNADCVEEFDISSTENIEPGMVMGQH